MILELLQGSRWTYSYGERLRGSLRDVSDLELKHYQYMVDRVLIREVC